MDAEDKKLTSSEIDDMLKEMEEYHQPIRKKNNDRKKRSKIRIDHIIAVIIAIVIIVLIIFGITRIVKHAGSSSDDSTENALMDEKYPEISDVVKVYLEAYLIEDDQERQEVLAQYVDNLGDISEVPRNEYVAGYSDVECYTKEGPYENTYVVYAYYQMKLKNISTKVPSITTLYVMRDSTTGNVYIHNGVSGETQDYINEVTKDDDVQELFASVNEEFEEALDSNEQLADFFAKLQETESSDDGDGDAQQTSADDAGAE